MSLFQRGEFTLHSGARSEWKIDCDALTDEDLATLAHVLVAHCWVRTFHDVVGVPTGGTRLATALASYVAKRTESTGLLVVDDVWTTGESLLGLMERYEPLPERVQGAVLFARGRLSGDVVALFTLGWTQR